MVSSSEDRAALFTGLLVSWVTVCVHMRGERPRLAVAVGGALGPASFTAGLRIPHLQGLDSTPVHLVKGSSVSFVPCVASDLRVWFLCIP